MKPSQNRPVLALPLILGISGVLALSGCQAVIPPPTSESSLHTPETLEAQSWRSSLGYAEKVEVNRHGSKIRRAALFLLSEMPLMEPRALAEALNRRCLAGAKILQVGTQTISLEAFPFPMNNVVDLSFERAPSRVLACLVLPKNTYEVSVWLLTREGYLSIDGYFPPNDPDRLRPEEQRRAIRAHSAHVYRSANAIWAEEFSLTAQDLAAGIEKVCKTGAETIQINGKTYPYGFQAAPPTTTTCTVVPNGDNDITVTVGSSLEGVCNRPARR